MPEYDLGDLDVGFDKYVSDARNLMCPGVCPSGVRETTRTLDDVTTVIRHDVANGTIGMKEDGDITTFFRPDDPWAYFEAEANR